MTISPPTGADISSEVLYTNEGGTALTRASGEPTWANSIDLELSRALTDNDDAKTLRLDMSFTFSGQSVHFRKDFSENFFHHLAVWTATSGKAIPTDCIFFANLRTRTSDTALSSINPRPWIVTRNSASNGNDIFRLQICDSSSQAAYTDIFATVSLIP